MVISRVEGYLDNPGWKDTDLLFERVSWAATARLALGDVAGARTLLTEGASGTWASLPETTSFNLANYLRKPELSQANSLVLYAGFGIVRLTKSINYYQILFFVSFDVRKCCCCECNTRFQVL